MNRKGNLWWGMVLIVLGVLFLLDNVNMLDFGEVFRTWWPALLVIWGISILFTRNKVTVATSEGATLDGSSSAGTSSGGSSSGASSSSGDTSKVFGDRNETPQADRLSYSTVFGDLSLRPASSNFKGGSISTVFGDTTIDLTAATLADGENKIKLSGVFGDTSFMLAPSMPYSLSANSLFGSIQAGGQKKDGFSSTMVIQSPEYATAARRMHIEVSQVFGDITLTR